MDYLGLYSAIQCEIILDYKYNLGTPKVLWKYRRLYRVISIIWSCVGLHRRDVVARPLHGRGSCYQAQFIDAVVKTLTFSRPYSRKVTHPQGPMGLGFGVGLRV